MIAAARVTNTIQLHREPKVCEQRIVIVCRDSVPIELVVVGVLQSDAHIGPWPTWRLASHERNVGDLEDKAVAVWAAGSVRRLQLTATIQRRV